MPDDSGSPLHIAGQAAGTNAVIRSGPDGAPRGVEPFGVPARGIPSESAGGLFRITVARALFVLVGLNAAQPMGILPDRLGPLPFAPAFNILTVGVTALYLAAWWSGRLLRLQIQAQLAVDLAFVTLLVGETQGIDSPFVSFYLVVITCASLMLGRTGGQAAAALSTILYAAIVFADRVGGNTVIQFHGATPPALKVVLHAMGFFAVAFLGGHLSQRVLAVEAELKTKIGSLERLQRLNEHIVRCIRSGLVTVDLGGSVRVFNTTAAELTGLDSTTTVGKSLSSVFGEKLWPVIRSTDFFRNLRPLRHEDWVPSADGQSRYFGFSVSPLLDEGDLLIGYIISFQDLTDIKRLEEEIRRQDRMAAIGRMAAGVAHEIRNPLTAIRGSVEILRSRSNLPPTDQRLLDILLRESDRLNRFVDDFLSLARPGQHRRDSIDMTSLLRDSVTLLRNSAEIQGKHQIVFDDCTAALLVSGDDGQLRQVFWNLAQNALRAMPIGGALTIRARRGPDDVCSVIFEDEGVGMSDEEQKMLFQPFSPGFPGGTGLGLSIVFRIIEDHGGKIEFSSRKGEGTRVKVSLPLEGKAERETAPR